MEKTIKYLLKLFIALTFTMNSLYILGTDVIENCEKDVLQGETERVEFRKESKLSWGQHDISRPYDIIISEINNTGTLGQVDVQVSITAHTDIQRLSLNYSTEGNVALSNALDSEIFDLISGVTITLTGTLDITSVGEGEFTVEANDFYNTACGEEVGAGLSISQFFVYDDNQHVFAGEISLIDLKIDSLISRYESGEVTLDQAYLEFENLHEVTGVPSEQLQAVTTENIEKVPSETYVSAASSDVVFNGLAQWTDVNGILHPARESIAYAYVNGTIVAETVTDSQGNFQFVLGTEIFGTGPRSLEVRVYADNTAATIRTRRTFLIFSTTPNRVFIRREFNDAVEGMVYVDEPFTANNYEVLDKTFGIADAMYTGYQYVASLESIPPAKVDVLYPERGSSHLNGLIKIETTDAFSWDTIMHEFGHYISYTYNITAAYGASHGCTTDLVQEYGKTNGNKLALNEAFATYFALAAQHSPNSMMPTIPFASDTKYHWAQVGARENPPNPSTAQYDVENIDTCTFSGEAGEMNISRMMWDIVDADSDGLDNIALGDIAFWQILRGAGEMQSTSDLYSALVQPLSTQDRINYGDVFSQNKIAPEIKSPSDGALIGINPSTFIWEKHKLNKFKVVFYDSTYTEIGSSLELGDVDEWTPSPSEWAVLSTAFTAAGPAPIFWVIEGSNSVSPVTGLYWSGAKTLSGVKFTFVIDDTGSMGQELDSTKNALLNHINTITPEDDPSFQLITFKDGLSIRQPTANLDVIRNQVNALSPSGGGDCPENSVGGLNAAVGKIVRGGTVFLATDADPSSGSIPAAVSALRASGARVNLVLSGLCSVTPSAVVSTLSTEQQSDSSTGLNLIQENTLQDGASTANAVVIENHNGVINSLDAYQQIVNATGGTLAILTRVNSSDQGKQQYQNVTENILNSALRPTVTVLRPSLLRQNSIATVTMSAQKTNFTDNSVVEFSGIGVTVLDVNALDALTLSVDISIAPDALIGFRDISVTTDLGARIETATGRGSLEILSGISLPVLASASPALLTIGETAIVTIRGVNTSFDQALTSVNFDSIISVQNVNVISPTHLEVTVTVDANTYPNIVNVAVVTGAEVANREIVDFITLEAPRIKLPSISNITPAEGALGEIIEIVINVNDMELNEASTTLGFTGSGINVLSFEICDNQIFAKIQIADTALVGTRDIVLTSSGLVVSAPDAFNVIADNGNKEGVSIIAEGNVQISSAYLEGDIAANGFVMINQGYPENILTGSITAGGDVLVKEGNTINGNASSAKQVKLNANSIIEGDISDGDEIETIELPTTVFVSGGQNITILVGEYIELEAGSYGNVYVEAGGELILSSDEEDGKYFFDKLTVSGGGKITMNIGASDILIHVTNNVVIGRNAFVAYDENLSLSDKIHWFTNMNFTIEENASVSGLINAVNGFVKMKDSSILRGTITADRVDLQKATQLYVP